MKSKNPIVSWLGLNRSLDRQRTLSLLLGVINGLLVIGISYLALSPPLVVSKNRDKKVFYKARRMNLAVTNSDLEDVASQFVFARYQWDKFDRDSIIKGVTPFISKNLSRKITKELLKLKKQFPKEKLISQSIANLKSEVTMKKIIISFDRILKVGGIPLVTPIDIEFLMMQGSPNHLNPMGIYINNVIQYEAI